MPRPPPLTDIQRKELANLEPALREAADQGDYERAKELTGRIQNTLRRSGHETRLMKSKTWLFEAAMEAGHLEVAKSGLRGVRDKTARNTRVHLEATLLLAICHIRARELATSESLIGQVLRDEGVIKSARERRSFRKRTLDRLGEETLLAALKRLPQDRLDVDDVQESAGYLVCNRTEAEIQQILGAQMLAYVLNDLADLERITRAQLPRVDQNLLPPPKAVAEPTSLGKRLIESARRVVWKALCDPQSEVYKAWYANGMQLVLEKKYFAACVIGELAQCGLALKGLAVSLVAVVIKLGLEVYCETFKPPMLLDAASKRG